MKGPAPGARGLTDAAHVRGQAGPQNRATVVRESKARNAGVILVSICSVCCRDGRGRCHRKHRLREVGPGDEPLSEPRRGQASTLPPVPSDFLAATDRKL